MKKHLLSSLFVLFLFSAGAQVIYDFETPETSTNFQNFGSGLEGILSNIIANPNASGINTSATVVENVKPAGSEVWAGVFTNPSPVNGVNTTMGGEICVDAHFDHIGTLSMKLENSSTGGVNWLSTQANQTVGAWETICFPFTAISEEGAGNNAVGHIYGNIAMFFDFGVSPSTDVVTYFDNIVVVPGNGEETTVTVLDWETPSTTTALTYFGSSLSDQPAANIPNPNPTGVNTSATVAEYVKAANSEVWAGAYCNPAVTSNVTSGLRICVDIHMDHIGNLALKLEASSTGGADWITTVENTVINEWETLCFELSAPSIEGDPVPAAGNIYEQLVLFPDFGQNFTEDQVYYIDNVVVVSGISEVVPAMVTFSVDMNSYTSSFTSVNVSGSFNDWSGDAFPLADDDLDGIYTGTFEIDNGAYEYLFTVDNWNDQEQFNGTESCVERFDDGNGSIFNNRTIAIIGDRTLPTYCFNSCFACGEGVSITFNLGVPSPDAGGVYLVGGAEFGPAGGAYLMTDPDGDNVFSITIERALGYEGFYSFANGNCPDYSCKENIAGQACARPDNFNDRFLDPITGTTEINTCFGQCTTDTNCGVATTSMVTFQVNMSETTVSGEGVRIAGQFSNWGDIDMTDADGDGIYTVTLELNKQPYEYKFKNGSEGWENLEVGTSCTVTTPDGMFTNRLADLANAADDELLPTVCFESCINCSTSTDNVAFNNDYLSIFPTVADDIVNVEIKSAYSNGVLNIVATNGAIISQINLNGTQQYNRIDVSSLSSGMYMILLSTDKFISSQKLFIK